jgi:predicted amidohydrolase YtcJ
MNYSPLRLRCLRLALVASLATLPSTRGAAAETAELILTGARVWTGETKTPWAEAVAIRGDRIVYVGSAKGAANLRTQKTEVRDLGGGLLLPGFNDSHVHLMEGAESLEKVDLIEDATLEAVQQHIKAFASENPKSPWVLGRGWFYGTFPGGLPTRAQLDAVVPDRPAYMTCYDGHSGWANSKALALAGITRATKDPENGVIVRDPATGEPTGALKESATDLVESKIPKPDAESRYALLLRALALLNSQGITSVQDAGSSDPAENTALYTRAKQYGRLTVRLSIATLMKEGDVEKPIAQAQRLRAESADHLLRYGTIKGFVDGVIEAKTAAVLDPYPDGGRGLPNWQPEALKAAVVAADKAGLQVYLHAIGDRGVRMALDAHEAAKTNGPRDRRGRIEHIETISAADYPRFAALGVIASMQPLHADPNQNLLEVWAKNAGPDRASRGFSWANLERAGARLVFGSDWPVVTSDVRRGLYCAVTRKTREGKPEGGWHPEMAVSLDSALRHYTIDAAYASFEEGVKGSLAPGKLADLVLLADDVFKAPPETTLKTRVVLTMLGGKIVYRAE